MEEAMAMLEEGGEDALQMKELAERSDVSLSTLYRYFPSKQHLILTILRERYLESQRRLRREQHQGDTVGERVANYMIRALRSQQRQPAFSAAVRNALAQAGPELITLRETVHDAYVGSIRIAAGPMTSAQLDTLMIVIGVADFAAGLWLAGQVSPAEARAYIITASRLLDLPDEAIYADRELARKAVDHAVGRPGRRAQAPADKVSEA
jgi:TetR/AcrR family transcriptional regulator, cholesterol catabolism regulator